MRISRRRFLASLAGMAACFGSQADARQPPSTFALSGRVLAGNNLEPLSAHAVLVRDGWIEDIVPTRSVRDRPLLGLPKTTIMPGIINAHCHGVHTPEARRDRWLAHGVTAIGDPGAPLTAMAELVRGPPGLTATAAFSGPVLTAPGGYPLPVHKPEHALIVRSPQGARDAVKKLADNGATMLKLAFEPGPLPVPWPLLDLPTAAAACDFGRRLGLVVRCHVQNLSCLETALAAGVDTIEHVPHHWTGNGEHLPVVTREGIVVPYYLKLLERMTRDAVTLTPTLDVLSRTPWNGPALFAPVRTFNRLGGRLATGNDFPYRRTGAGMILEELSLLRRAGLTGKAVLRAATVGAAKACGFTDRGVIAPGMRADLLLTTGDPVTDHGTLKTPLLVVKDGRFFDPAPTIDGRTPA